jgi:CBS domain-containing protein
MIKHRKIGSVMTDEVVTARYGTPLKEVARLLGEHRIGGVPVIDDDEKVIGVLSGTDLVNRQAAGLGRPPGVLRGRLGWLFPSVRGARARAAARTAGALMSAPAITVKADVGVAEAARTMAERGIERLPVVDEEDRLVGIVSRRDLLQVYLRSDGEIVREIAEDLLVDTMWLAPGTVTTQVHDGVVTLRGVVERRSDKSVALRLAEHVDGVVAVVDQLTYRIDDSHTELGEYATHGVTEHWLRKP